jgi:predicted dehydrogenase
MTDAEIRIAMIGCGRRAPAYPRSIRAVKGCRVVALCDRIAPRIKQIKSMFGDEKIREYTDHRKMFAEGGFDAVVIVTEPEYQALLSVEAMEAGYHVFSEVPASYSLDECWKLVVTAERTRRAYYLGEQVRHTPLMRHWRQMVRSGSLGSVLFAEGHYIHGMAADRHWLNPETGSLLTWEQAQKVPNKVKSRLWTMPHPILYGPHELSPLLKVLDDRVVRVSCFSTGRPNKRCKEVPFPCQNEEFPIPDMEVALMHTAKGAILRFAASFSTPISETHWYHLLGTKGEVETRRGSDETGHSYFYPVPILQDVVCRFARTKQPWFHLSGRPPEVIPGVNDEELTAEARTTGHGGTDYFPMADFIRGLREGTPPDIDVYQAVETAAPCILAARAAEEEGATLTVPDFRPGPGRKPGEMPKKRL